MSPTLTIAVDELSSQPLYPIRLTKPANEYRNAHPYAASASNIHDFSPEELVDKALRALQQVGVELIEWKSLLYRRMGVPLMVKDYHYLVPDEQLQLAFKVVEEEQGLPRSIPPSLLLQTGGDFYAKASMYRVTQSTSVALAQHLVLYPASMAAYSPADLEPQPRLTSLPHPLCETVLVPKPAAVYASTLRMMRSYPRYSPTRITLESDLSELIGYNLYGLEGGYLDVDDDGLCAELEVDQRIEDAAHTVEMWRMADQLHDDEGWIANWLADVVSGKRTVEDIPWADTHP
ncbi:hypothetical protein BV20DRAFT_972008 [Pilatotrama ljubarskyi]|nr:hypothetical protein BV20DRAFT_972008 [Pilatotrama ljubarskyi]